jgi:HAE1 family hydrophobic/amphiphilic exporter-1
LLLVFGVLFLIVGLKEAFVAGLAIPLVFFVSFGVLLSLGISLNFLSLFSLILSLGLLVDDAIVVVSATKQYLNSGKFTPEEAVLLVLTDFKWVLTTTTLTTIWAFLPMLFSTGIMGQYIKSIPVTVSITLKTSLLIALMVNHPLAAVLERMRVTRKNFVLIEFLLIGIAGYFLYVGGAVGFFLGALLIVIEIGLVWWYERTGKEIFIKNEGLVETEWSSDEVIKNKLRQQANRHDHDIWSRLMHGIIHFNLLLPYYEKYLRYFVVNRKRRIILLISVFLIFMGSLGLVVTGVVKSEFFPVSDSDFTYVDIRTPIGSTLDLTDNVTKQVEEKLLKYKEIANFSTIIGSPSPMNKSGGSGASNVASITMTLKDKSDRKLKSFEFANVLRKDLAGINGGIITVATPSNGPPGGAAFEARIRGNDLGKLTNIAHDLVPYLSEIPGVVNIDISLKDSVPEYTFKLNPIKLEQNNLNAAYVGSVLRMAVSGLELTTIIKDEKEIKIIGTFDPESIPDLQSIQNLQILNLANQPVFLRDVADIQLTPAVNSISRIDQKRTVKLTASVSGTTNATVVLADFQKKIAKYVLPDGYSIVYGGENEQNTESVLSILRAMIIAVVLIIATLVIQFNSFKKAIIVLVTIPLALIGVFIGMAIFNVSLSFPALIGVLALFGIVVKNAIILMDKINLNIKTGIPFTDSIVDAGRSRLEAIFITSICTILGILPISLSNELWRSLGGSVIFGLSISSLLTLFIIPALYLSFINENER